MNSAPLIKAVTFMSALVAILSFVEDHGAQDSSEVVIITVSPDGTAATWRQNEVYDTFQDGGRFYVVRYNRSLERVSETDYQKLVAARLR